MSDWTGGSQNVLAQLNATSAFKTDRAEKDFYATPPSAVEKLLELETFKPRVWECACGKGHISEVLKMNGYNVKSTDSVDRGYVLYDGVVDFLAQSSLFNGDIVTNPPFRYATEFVERAMDVLPIGNKAAFLLRIQFLEGVRRYEMFRKYPPARIHVASRTIRCARNGDFANATGNASTYAWFVWVRGNTKLPTVDWFK